jgi:hypothetical protein
MKLSKALSIGAFASLLPFSAFANEARQHDAGFFLRLAAGGGSFSSTIDDGIDELGLSGPAGNFDVAVGFVPTPNLAVHASFGAWATVDPTLEINSVDFDTDDLTVSVSTFGVGATYYLGPSNFYLTGTLALAKLTVDFDGDDADTGTGFAFEAGAGKEWWLGNKFGLGVGAVVAFHSVPDEELDERFSGTSFGLRVTGTFN